MLGITLAPHANTQGVGVAATAAAWVSVGQGAKALLPLWRCSRAKVGRKAQLAFAMLLLIGRLGLMLLLQAEFRTLNTFLVSHCGPPISLGHTWCRTLSRDILPAVNARPFFLGRQCFQTICMYPSSLGLALAHCICSAEPFDRHEVAGGGTLHPPRNVKKS